MRQGVLCPLPCERINGAGSIHCAETDFSMQTTTPTHEPDRCPLCGRGNRCAMEIERVTGQAQPPCWCTTASFPPDLLARLPVEAAGRACICAGCLAAFRQAPTGVNA